MHKDCPQQVSSMPFLFSPILIMSHLSAPGVYPGSRASTWYHLTCLQSLPILIVLLFQVMQSQMIGMQSSLDRILSAVQTQTGNGPQLYTPMEAHRDGTPITHRNGFDAGPASTMRSFPPLPGFIPPVSLVLLRPSLYWSHPSIAS